MQVSMTRRIAAERERVFDVFSDLRHAAGRIAAIKRLEVLTEGPIRKGTRFRETRIMFNREATEEMEIVDFLPGRSYTVQCLSCGVLWSSTFRFEAAGGETEVSLDMSCKPKTFFARLMSPLGRLMAGGMLKCVGQDLEDLKKFAEAPRA